jgi:hypothetical protein
VEEQEAAVEQLVEDKLRLVAELEKALRGSAAREAGS